MRDRIGIGAAAPKHHAADGVARRKAMLTIQVGLEPTIFALDLDEIDETSGVSLCM